MSVTVALEMPDDVADFRFPEALNNRLHHLLDRQDEGVALTEEERREAEALIDLAEMLSLLRLKSEDASRLAS
jgi:hypothetical protein